MIADYIKVGDKVTVQAWKSHDRVVGGGIFDMGPAVVVKSQNRSFMGDVLTVVALELPYIAVDRGGRRYEIDTREATLMPLSEDYVTAMTGDVTP